MSAQMSGRRSVTVVGGFLGSGKTTLIRHWAKTAGGPVAVVVNEFGEVSLDHRIVREATEVTVAVAGGCACCTRRQDLLESLRALLDEEEKGERPRAAELVIETSGVADPAPIAFTVGEDPVLRHRFAIDRIVVTVDSVVGLATLTKHPEARKQILVADDLLLTKVDLVDRKRCRELGDRLQSLNPWARVSLAAHGQVVELLAPGACRQREEGIAPRTFPTFAPAHADATNHFRALRLSCAPGMDWAVLVAWLTLLLHAHGDRVLRTKGIVNVKNVGEVALNAVQHVMYPPEHLGGGPGSRVLSSNKVSELVFILKDLDPETVRRSFDTFAGAF
jgi:G3E family GTPase